MQPFICILLLLIALPQLLRAQFVPELLQNRSYWGDGKSEIDFYQAEFVRDGEPHPCELLLTLTPLFAEPATMAVIDTAKNPGAIPAIHMNEVATIPRGLTAEARSIEALWRMDSMSLARLSFSGNDGSGNIAKTVRENRETGRVSWTYSCDNYTGKADPTPITLGTKQVVLYDELPLRVRTLDFSKPNGELEIDIAATLASPGKEFGELKPAKISWKTDERRIHIEVQHPAGKDQLTLDSTFPFLLREWVASDGMRWKMKNSLKADYRKYLRTGDRERAWNDPMLRHPD
jgi:hypothetical protein